MNARFKHTNIIARDWEALAAFYQNVFGCIPVPPQRHLSGAWLAKGTGVYDAQLDGVHLRLPGYGENGPTLEIYKYTENKRKLLPVANREGFAHIAFEVDDIATATTEVLEHGGKKVGEVTTHEVEGVGKLSFVYLADLEGNIIELQVWQ